MICGHKLYLYYQDFHERPGPEVQVRRVLSRAIHEELEALLKEEEEEEELEEEVLQKTVMRYIAYMAEDSKQDCPQETVFEYFHHHPVTSANTMESVSSPNCCRRTALWLSRCCPSYS